MSSNYLPCIIAGATGAALMAVAPHFTSSAQAQSRLLPFQGRLTDAAGNAVGDGARVVEFKLYDAPTGGNVKWAGEVHRLSVNAGLVNTMLGSKASLGGVDFATATFLQITVDANGDGAITAADPPLLPRQSVVPAVFASEALSARDAVKLAGADWSSIMVDGAGAPTNAPGTGFVRGAKVQAGGIAGPQLADNAVSSAKVANGSLTADDLGTGSVGTDEIINGSIQSQDLSSALQTSLVLPGSVISYAGDTAPANSGWLLCDGRELPVASFPALAAVLGTKYGVPTQNAPATHFKLPDYRGLFLRGVDDPDGPGGLQAAGRDPDSAGRTVMAVGGNVAGNVGSVQADSIQQHTHNAPDDGAGFFESKASPAPFLLSQGNFWGWRQASKTGLGTITTAQFSTETRPRNAYVNYLIKY